MLIKKELSCCALAKCSSSWFLLTTKLKYVILLRFEGGWASASFPHMVVYCIKFIPQGESPRDYVDMLWSFKYPPSISISDIPQRLAAHANSTISRFFRPNEGRLFLPTEDNINPAKEESLILNLPWVQGALIPRAFQFGSESFEEELHSVTGVSERYSLFDRFHERNFTSPSDLLHRVTLVPEFNMVVNTEVEEQLHNSIYHSNYSFNPFVGKRTNSSATYPYPFRYPWGPFLSLFVATKDYYRMSSHVFPSLCSLLDIFARFAPFLRQKTRVFNLYSI